MADGLPSSQTGPALGSLVSGVADVKFVGGTLYALEAGAGCSHGLLNTDNELLRVNSDGTTTPIANLSAYQKLHPVAQPNEPDFEPDGTWYSMVVVRDDFRGRANHGEVVQIDPSTGAITRVADVPSQPGHTSRRRLPTPEFLFGNLGRSRLRRALGHLRLTPSGQIKKNTDDLTTVRRPTSARIGCSCSSR